MSGPLLDALFAVVRERGCRAWLVGGSVRDRELGVVGPDVDVVVDDDPARFAAAVAARTGRPWFELSRAWGAFRVVGDPGHIDVSALRGGGLEADLALRDFTVNAMALPVEGGEVVDPFGGRAHLQQRRLVPVSSRVFADDPLRMMRAVRLAHTLGLTIDPELRRLARRDATLLRVAAAERVLSEVILTLAGGRSAAAVHRWADLGLLDVFLPEVVALRGVVQSPFHHLDVYGHTLAALDEVDAILERPGARFGLSWELLERRLAEPVDGVMPRPVAVRLGTLLHDVAKPQTKALDEQGRILFWGHTEVGGPVAQDVCGRLRCSAAATALVRAVVERHLDLGFLQHELPLKPRSAVRYLWAAAPFEPEVVMVSVADRLATRGPRTEEHFVAGHVALAHELMDLWRARVTSGIPRPPITGLDVMEQLEIPPGPLLGLVLREVSLAWEAGEIFDREEALAHAGRYLQRAREAGAAPEDEG